MWIVFSSLINISFSLQVNSHEIQYIPAQDNFFASRLSLKLHLQSIHFQNSVPMNQLNSIFAENRPVGGLVLRCTAQIGNLYQEYREVELGAPQKDPVPARGMYMNIFLTSCV